MFIDCDLTFEFIYFISFKVASVTAFVAYELVTNPEVQRKLQAEIDEVESQLNGKALNYEKLQAMKKYMDQVVSETLRLWPAAPMADRQCVKDYEVEYDDKKFTIEARKSFYIPIHGIHQDERFFKNPKKFDPERFSDDMKTRAISIRISTCLLVRKLFSEEIVS